MLTTAIVCLFFIKHCDFFGVFFLAVKYNYESSRRVLTLYSLKDDCTLIVHMSTLRQWFYDIYRLL